MSTNLLQTKETQCFYIVVVFSMTAKVSAHNYLRLLVPKLCHGQWIKNKLTVMRTCLKILSFNESI